jgi:hypothetical protein
MCKRMKAGAAFLCGDPMYPAPNLPPEKTTSGGFVICQNVDSWNLRFYDSTGNELESWDSSSLTEQKDKAPVAVKIELALVNLNDKEKPYKFMTKVFLPVKKQTP